MIMARLTVNEYWAISKLAISEYKWYLRGSETPFYVLPFR